MLGIRQVFAGCLLVTLPLAMGGISLAADERDVRSVLNAAKSRAKDIPGQAEALTSLAWPVDGPADPLVQAAARKELVDFGNYAMTALRNALVRVDPVYGADVVTTLIEARRNHHSGNPGDYLPALEEAIWFGSIGARRVGMLEISRYRFPPAMLTTIDAIHDHPELTALGIRSLGRMRDERARFFLTRVLDHADPQFKSGAARSLGQVGETGHAALRERVASETRTIREAAIDALLPYSSPDDLTAFHEYVATHGGDDSGVVERVRARAVELEEILEQQQLSEAASAEPESDPQP